MKHSLLQETPINDNMTSVDETNDIMTSNEETKEDTVNSASHHKLDSWLKRELLTINEALTELKKKHFKVELNGPKTMNFDYCGLITIVSKWRFQHACRKKTG